MADAAARGSRALQRAAKYASLIAGAALAAVVVGILVNALALQKARHPAPFFGRSFPLPQAAPPAAPSAPTPAAAAEPEAAETSLRAHPTDATDARPDTRAQGRDPIAQLLRGSLASSRPAAPAQPEPKPVPARPDPIKAELQKVEAGKSEAGKSEAGKPEPTRAVAAAQHALVKLGFVLRADGLMGTTTRQALEQFARDHGLPANGELTPRLRRELAAQSGIAIE